MKDRRLQRVGGITAISIATILGVVLAYDFLFPAQPRPGQSAITIHDDENGGRRICGPPEPTDAILEQARVMGEKGAPSDDVITYIRRETDKLSPRCVTLFQVPH